VADRIGEAAALDNIGVAYASMGQYPEALKHHQQALDIRREMGEREGEAISLQNLGFAYEHQGQPDQALDAYRQSIEVYESIRASATVEEIKAALAGRPWMLTNTPCFVASSRGPSEAFNISGAPAPDISRSTGNQILTSVLGRIKTGSSRTRRSIRSAPSAQNCRGRQC
jgi:tetratricopeptide (TPR) repeat protein